MDTPDLIWVEVEIQECSDETNSYCGQIGILDLENIENGEYIKKFLKIRQVHWYRYPDTEEEKLGKERELKRYGEGKHSHYQGEIYLKSDNIFAISRLRHGPKNFEDGIDSID